MLWRKWQRAFNPKFSSGNLSVFFVFNNQCLPKERQKMVSIDQKARSGFAKIRRD
jgi:hypothetical protein